MKPIWFLNVPFEWRPVMSRLGVKWDNHYKQSVYEGDLPAHLQPFKCHPLSWMWHQQYHANGRHLEPLQRDEIVYIARDHQKTASKRMTVASKAGAPGFLLADEVGVGKTMSAWDFALSNSQYKTILIVTTSSAQAHWRNTVRHAGWLPTHSIVIINYDQLGKLFVLPEDGLTSTRKKGMRKRVAKQAQAPSFDLVIFDESHKGKNPTSARGVMMQKIQAKSKFCIFASATAGQNPIELIYLSSLLAFASGKKVPNKDLSEFKQWCVQQGLKISTGAYGKIEWEYNEEDLEKIHQWLFGGKVPLGIRRLPEDIANWPALFRQLYPIDFDPQESQAYAKMWDDFVAEEIKQRSNSGKRTTELENNRLRLRQESSWLRISTTVDETLDLIEQGKKVAISVAFRPNLEELVRRFKENKVDVVEIHGSLTPTEKEDARLSFQKGSAKVVVFTVEEAISLHQGEFPNDPFPRVLLIHDVRWSAIQMAQIEGRCHRDGKEAPVFWMVAADTVDIDIAEVMIAKIKNMKAMHGDKVGDIQDIERVLQKYIKQK